MNFDIFDTIFNDLPNVILFLTHISPAFNNTTKEEVTYTLSHSYLLYHLSEHHH